MAARRAAILGQEPRQFGQEFAPAIFKPLTIAPASLAAVTHVTTCPERAVAFTRPRGYIATGRDVHPLDGQPVHGVAAGLPTEGTFTVPIPGPERGVPVSLNGEAFVARSIPGALSFAEFHY